jgi:hypothetical protein
MKKSFRGPLAHKPLKKESRPVSQREEFEIAKDLVLQDISLYSKEEIVEMIKNGIVSLKEVEEVCSPSNA